MSELLERPSSRRRAGKVDVTSDDGGPEIRRGGMALIAFFGVFLGWAALAPLDAAVVAPGVVVVANNRQTIQHREGGTVERLNVREGQQVAAGEILLELRAPEIVAQERALFAQQVDRQMQRARLDAELAGSREIVRPAEWANLQGEDLAVADAAFARHQQEASRGASRSAFGALISGYREEIATIRRQEALLSEELEGMRALAADGLAPLTRVRALERSLAELQGRRAQLTGQIAATQQNRSEEVRTIEAQLAEINPQLASARERLEQSRLRAPVAGLVVGLTVHTVGGVVRPGEPVMDIVPEGQELVVEARVRPEDADDLQIGQVAEVRITAFHGRSLPRVNGTVRQISADRFTDQQTGQGYFRAQIEVAPEELARIEDRAQGGGRLRAGLPAEIVAPTRKRTALQYLFEPLNQAMWRSFRES